MLVVSFGGPQLEVTLETYELSIQKNSNYCMMHDVNKIRVFDVHQICLVDYLKKKESANWHYNGTGKTQESRESTVLSN